VGSFLAEGFSTFPNARLVQGRMRSRVVGFTVATVTARCAESHQGAGRSWGELWTTAEFVAEGMRGRELS